MATFYNSVETCHRLGMSTDALQRAMCCSPKQPGIRCILSAAPEPMHGRNPEAPLQSCLSPGISVHLSGNTRVGSWPLVLLGPIGQRCQTWSLQHQHPTWHMMWSPPSHWLSGRCNTIAITSQLLCHKSLFTITLRQQLS